MQPNIQTQYELLRENKISEYDFRREAVNSFSNFVHPSNTTQDMISILKQRSVLSDPQFSKGQTHII